MKISKITWFILILGVAIIGAVGLYFVYDDEIEKQESLQASITTAQESLPNIASTKQNLENQIADLDEELDAVEADLLESLDLFPNDVQSIFYGDLLFFFTRQFDMRMTSFTSSGPLTLEANGISYTAATFTVDIETDEVDSIMSYLTTLELGDDFATTRINSVSSQIVQDDPNTPEEELSTVSITITILSYGGN